MLVRFVTSYQIYALQTVKILDLFSKSRTSVCREEGRGGEMISLNTTYTLWLVNPTKLEDVDLKGCPKLSIKAFSDTSKLCGCILFKIFIWLIADFLSMVTLRMFRLHSNHCLHSSQSGGR
jgi:hypothetical protein